MKPCVFRHKLTCDISGNNCTNCDDNLIEIEALDYKDHYLIYEKRKQIKSEKKLKVSSIFISIIALLVSIGNAFFENVKHQKPISKYYYIDKTTLNDLQMNTIPDTTINKFKFIENIKFANTQQISIILKKSLSNEEFNLYNYKIINNLLIE
jgi:hypothetical protein